MIAIPGDTKATTIAGIIADEMRHRYGQPEDHGRASDSGHRKRRGRDTVEFGGLLGYAPIMPVNQFSCDAFVNRKRKNSGTDSQL